MPAKLFTTPSDIPEGVACRTLKIPNNGIWLGIFNAALLETVNKYNWEQIYDTDMTIEETVLACQAIINEYWDESGECGGGDCLQPNGSKVVRQNLTGHWEQLNGDAWGTPDGDYTVPPVPERSESTAYERKCLAAANAQYVLEVVYEVASDAVNEGLDQGEVVALIIAEVGALLGLFGALFAAAVFGLVAAALRSFLALMEFLTSDVWDDGFSDVLRCVLYDCATDTDAVVTFDLQCVYDKLAASFDAFDPDAIYYIRLVNQVAFMLSFIGADGLNAAGGTTAVETANCDDCTGWCYEVDFKETPGEFFEPNPDATFANTHWQSGIGWASGGVSSPGGISAVAIFASWSPESTTVTRFEASFEIPTGTFMAGNDGVRIWDEFGSTQRYVVNGAVTTETLDSGEILEAGIGAADIYCSGYPYGLDDQIRITHFKIWGVGTNPFSESNCEE